MLLRILIATTAACAPRALIVERESPRAARRAGRGLAGPPAAFHHHREQR